MNNDLEKAITIAVNAHQGQRDKAGEPYILHPLRLMFKVTLEKEKIVALLHDVVEDSELTLEKLNEIGFDDEVIAAVNCLTHRENESYEDFIKRILNNTLAIKVKIEDIKDNLDLTRLKSISEKDLLRVEKYHHALKILLN